MMNYFAASALLSTGTMLLVPVAIIATFAIILIPSLLVQGAKPELAARAISCCVLKSLAIVLIFFSGLQLVLSVLSGNFMVDKTIITSLTILVVLGIIMLIHQVKVLQKIDEASSIVPQVIFLYSYELIGVLLSLFATLTLVVSSILEGGAFAWRIPATVLIIGLIISIASSLHVRSLQTKWKKIKKK